MKIAAVFLLILSTTFCIESNFYSEDTCMRINGFCVLENECPHTVSKAHKGLCPMQQSQGAVCCKNFPAESANCFQTHNTCYKLDSCPQSLNAGRKGCPVGETCCILV